MGLGAALGQAEEGQARQVVFECPIISSTEEVHTVRMHMPEECIHILQMWFAHPLLWSIIWFPSN